MHPTVSQATVAGPYFDELEPGQTFGDAPGLTLDEGHAAVHQALVGSRLRLCLDAHLAQAVTGEQGRLAHPNLVCDVAIGQSTSATGRVLANLFYRGLTFHRLPRLGDTLRTRTEVIGLKQNAARSTGLVVLRVVCRDHCDRPVLDFLRCAMLPVRDASARTGHADDVTRLAAPAKPPLENLLGGWDLEAYRIAAPGRHLADIRHGEVLDVATGDVVSAAPELVRLSLNLAAVHSDVRAAVAGRRLVYGGYTIGLAAAHVLRALPNALSLVAWQSCDHLAPVREGDTLSTQVEVERITVFAGGGGVLHLRCLSSVHRPGESPTDVLLWTPAVLMA